MPLPRRAPQWLGLCCCLGGGGNPPHQVGFLGGPLTKHCGSTGISSPDFAVVSRRLGTCRDLILLRACLSVAVCGVQLVHPCRDATHSAEGAVGLSASLALVYVRGQLMYRCLYGSVGCAALTMLRVSSPYASPGTYTLGGHTMRRRFG